MLKTKLLISTLVECHFSGPESQEAISLLRKLRGASKGTGVHCIARSARKPR